MADIIRQGNMVKLTVTLTENSVAYADLGTADVVKMAIYNYATKAIALQVDTPDSNITLDDGGTGIISWQLTSPQTNALAVGHYGLAIQIEASSNILEWDEGVSLQVVQQIISNS